MRIIHIIETLHVGGAERMLIDLVVEQVKKGHAVAVICVFELGEFASELSDQNIPVYCCEKRHGSTLKPLWNLLKTIYAFKADVLHTHNCLSNYYLALVYCLVGRNKMFINTFHGIGVAAIGSRKAKFFGWSLYANDQVVTVCDVANQSLKACFPKFESKIITVVNGVVINRFKLRNPENKRNLLDEIGSSLKDTQLIGIVARLNPVKNHQLLFDAFAKVLEQLKHVKLVVIGDGELRQKLERYAKTISIDSSIHFLGDRRDVNELLAGLDVYVLSSDKEGYSISLLEAVATGLPVVATDVGGNAEIIQHEKNGLIVPPKDIDALSEALITILEDPDLASQMGESSRRWAEQYGSVEAMADTYQKIYIGQ